MRGWSLLAVAGVVAVSVSSAASATPPGASVLQCLRAHGAEFINTSAEAKLARRALRRGRLIVSSSSASATTDVWQLRTPGPPSVWVLLDWRGHHPGATRRASARRAATRAALRAIDRRTSADPGRTVLLDRATGHQEMLLERWCLTGWGHIAFRDIG